MNSPVEESPPVVSRNDLGRDAFPHRIDDAAVPAAKIRGAAALRVSRGNLVLLPSESSRNRTAVFSSPV